MLALRACRRFVMVLTLVAGFLLPIASYAADQSALLWEIGKADNGFAEFALAPNGFGRLREDGFCVVGQFKPDRDWPYVQPGPGDVWAGGRPHTFTVVFGVKNAPTAGSCRLLVDLVDTHAGAPPELRIDVNSATFKVKTPRGGGDDSVHGQAAKGKECKFEVAFPAEVLKGGVNEIGITTTNGSWILYDWVGLETPAGVELAPVQGTVVGAVRATPALIEKNGRMCQMLQIPIRHFGDAVDAVVRVTGGEPMQISLKAGVQTVEAVVPAVEKETGVAISVDVAGKTIAAEQRTLAPVRKWEVYLLPHSHVDIGYTLVQTEVEKRQWSHLDAALAACLRTANYPAGSKYKWNVEVLWAVDSYLRNATPEKRKAFIDAVKSGQVGLQALYGNELTALCRPEELVRLVECAKRLENEIGVPVDSAMISDVPGYTWGIVPVFANSGVKYFSVGPNQGDRIGFTLAAWGDKPFWWIGPNGKDRILCWIAGKGYSNFHGATLSKAGEGPVFEYLKELGQSAYPYDMVQVRYNTGGDNGPPDTELPEFVKAWNSKYAYPKLIIATSSELCREFDKRYGEKLPSVSGDFTPYWEDGAGSSSRETAMNREAAERLSQAEALFAVLDPRKYPSGDFYQAWRNVILYDEHTWGAHNSISEPDKAFVKDQWAIKQAFAVDADKQSRKLLDAALAGAGESKAQAVDVFNTSSWARTDLVTLPKELGAGPFVVAGPDGQAVATQRLSSGETVFVAKNVPPFAAMRYSVKAGPNAPADPNAASAAWSTLDFKIKIDEATGAITGLESRLLGVNLADIRGGVALNAYRYVPGANPKDAQTNGVPKISIKDSGPVVASMLVESDAPGCNKLTREIRVVNGVDHVDIINTLDKKAVRTKEGVHFGFAFNVPDGVVRMDVPFAVVRPELDQMKGACKNWFTVQRWVDISNADYGVTWATIDAPLVEVGAITADVTGGIPWLEHLAPSQTLYSYVMNNYWHTNYKADQDGLTVFRYAIRPHKAYRTEEAARFGMECSQPLVAALAKGEVSTQPRLQIDAPGVIVSALKPSEDGKAWIVRLFGASEQAQKATLTWSAPAPKSLFLSDIAEKPVAPITGPIDVPPFGMVTVRAEMP